MKAKDRIILVRVKIEWAKKQLRNLAAEVLALEHTHVVFKKDDSEVDPHPIVFSWGDNPHPIVKVLAFDAVCLAGDIIHNLRSALDHLAMQLALLGNPNLSDKELKQIEFPIAESPEKYENSKARQLNGIRTDAMHAIDRLKPYKGGNDDLWNLHVLDIIDKHRTLLTLDSDFIFTADWFPGSYYMKTDNPHFSGVEPPVENDIKTDIQEALSRPHREQANTLLPTIHQLIVFVENLVLGFEPLLG